MDEELTIERQMQILYAVKFVMSLLERRNFQQS